MRLAGGGLNRANLTDDRFQGFRHLRVHRRGIAAFHEVRLVAVADEERFELFVADARQDGGVGDLVAVQVENRQHRTVASRVEELVRVPGGRERTGLCLAVADDAGDDQIRIVEGHAVGVRQAVAELSPLVNRPRGLRRHVAADVAGEGELLEELSETLDVLALVRIDLRIRAFEVGRPEHARRAVAGARHEDHVEIVADDHPVQVHPDEREGGARPPVAEQPVLHVLRAQRFAQQRIVLEIDHPDRQVIAGSPVRIQQLEFLCGVGRRRCRQHLQASVRYFCLHSLLLFSYQLSAISYQLFHRRSGSKLITDGEC